MAKRQDGEKPTNWCFDGSLGDVGGVASAEAWKAGNLFRVAWMRPVAATSGPEFRGYRGIKA